MEPRTFASVEEWQAEGVRLFGEDRMRWAFMCPRCGIVSTVQDFKDAGAHIEAVAQDCIGRHRNDIGCDWAAYGLFDICMVHIVARPVFAFADPSICRKCGERITDTKISDPRHIGLCCRCYQETKGVT